MREAYSFERAFPSFYRNVSSTWTIDEADALKFYQKVCDKVFGIFNDDKSLTALVYFEKITEDVVNVHFDLKRGTDIKEIVYAIAGIRDYQFHYGVRICEAWILKKNRGVRKMLEAIGFKPTFLEMKSGYSHGQVLKWTQLAIAQNSYDKAEVMA